MSLASEHHVSLEIPELGPYLGRLVAPPVIETGQRHWIPLEDIRYELVTEVFVRSGEAREWCAADDPDLTIATLGRSVWLGLWERALTAVSQRASQAINARLEAAAEESRMPRRFRKRLPLGSDEAFALHSRLDAGAGPSAKQLIASRQRPTPPAPHRARAPRRRTGPTCSPPSPAGSNPHGSALRKPPRRNGCAGRVTWRKCGRGGGRCGHWSLFRC